MTVDWGHLTKSQRRAIHDAIRQYGLDPNDFGWAVTDALFAGHVDGECPMIYHKSDPDSLQFRFALGRPEEVYDDMKTYSSPPWRGQHCCWYKPNKEGTAGDLIQVPWSDILTEFQYWTHCVHDEVDAVDPWEVGETARNALVTHRNDDNSKFTKQEVPILNHHLDLLLGEIKTVVDLQAHQSAELAQFIAEQKDSCERLGKKDWKNAFIGGLTGLFMSLSINGEAARTILNLAGNALSIISAGPHHLLP